MERQKKPSEKADDQAVLSSVPDVRFSFPGINATDPSSRPTVYALGCFDGLHIGHRKVIDRAVRLAESEGKRAAVFTFPEPPRNVIFPGSAPPIFSPTEKEKRLLSIGAGLVVMPPFGPQIASLSPETFVTDLLGGALGAKDLFCGENYTFGKGACGNVALLAGLCEKNGMRLHVAKTERYGNETVSSTRLREAIRTGDTPSVSAMLGRPYSVSGTVTHGNALARTWGFPTANLPLPENVLLPRFGVYFCRVAVGEKTYDGIANVGIRPTVDGRQALTEVHLLDFDETVYGKELTVDLVHFHRPETRFADKDELVRQITSDVAAARAYHRLAADRQEKP